LTGVRPFESNNPAALRDQIRGEDPPPPRSLNEEVPEEVERICLKCLAKRPEGRYSSAQELAGEVRSQLRKRAGEPRLQYAVLALATLIVAFHAYRALLFVGYATYSAFVGDSSAPPLNQAPNPTVQQTRAKAHDLLVAKGMERMDAKDFRSAIRHFDA